MKSLRNTCGAMMRWAKGRGVPKVLGTVSLLALVGTVGCKNVGFFIPGPTFRGITVPIPPPAYGGEDYVRIAIDGKLPSGYGDEGATRVYVLEEESMRGYFTFADEGEYLIEDVLVDPTNNCLRSWFEDREADVDSARQDYKVIISTDEEECNDPDAGCSEPDEEGACLCLERWNTGC